MVSTERDIFLLDRREIAEFATSPAAVRSYEAIQQQALQSTPVEVAAAQTAADTAQTAATAAQGQADAAVAGLAGKQDLDAGLTSLAALATTLGLVEQTAAQVFAVRPIGVASATDVPTRANGDMRYVRQDQGPAWTAPTGTAARGAFATYTAPVIAGPTVAEVQAIADAVQAVSRALKAVVDDLTANGALNG